MSPSPPTTESPAPRCALRVESEPGSAPRLDAFLGRERDVFPSKKAAYKAAKRGLIHLNGTPARPDDMVRDGDDIAVFEPPDIVLPVPRFRPPLLWLDADVAVVFKPAGVPVMGLFDNSLEQACAGTLPVSPSASPLPRAKPVHRLDVPTTGLVLVARTHHALRELSRQFRDCEVRKRYRAVVVGRLEGEGVIRTEVDGRAALTRYRALPAVRSLHTGWITPIDAWPRTGRTHQIRRHLAGIGHAVAGDDLYGEPGNVLHGKGLFLCATAVAFRHPRSGKGVGVCVEPPAKFASYLKREARRAAI